MSDTRQKLRNSAGKQSNHARIECDNCGEHIYTRWESDGRIASFPKTCPECGAPTPKDDR